MAATIANNKYEYVLPRFHIEIEAFDGIFSNLPKECRKAKSKLDYKNRLL